LPNEERQDPSGAATATRARTPRTSTILRRLLDEHPNDSFTVEQLCAALGASAFGTSLLVFSVPELLPLPVPGLSAAVGVPTALVSAQMAAGYQEIRLPGWILQRTVPRQAVAGAIRAVLPVLQRAERTVRPRGARWVAHPLTRRVLGVFLFLLALAIALPAPITNSPPAIAVFVTALGLAERDGLIVALGVLLGLASLLLLAAVGFGVVTLLTRWLIPA
jgi:hypothetical protein